MRIAAHTLKGSVANVGGQLAREQAARLEEMGRSNQFDGATEALAALENAVTKLFKAFAGAGLAPPPRGSPPGEPARGAVFRARSPRRQERR